MGWIAALLWVLLWGITALLGRVLNLRSVTCLLLMTVLARRVVRLWRLGLWCAVTTV